MTGAKKDAVVFLNPRTCGIYKNGGVRYKTDPTTGKRTAEVDNELIEAVDAYLSGISTSCEARVPLKDVFGKAVLAPTYYDDRFNEPIRALLKRNGLQGVTIGQLLTDGVISVRGGHGSPGNDQRTGHIPYVKVSDIRALRVNVNPTNLVRRSVAERFWRGKTSKLKAWDVITPNRASSNIGEFAALLPGEEEVVLTKEMFVFRVEDTSVWDAFYLLWALSLSAVREQWRRVTLMQTNREDCGDRYREVILPKPVDQRWALDVSRTFRDYFTKLAGAKQVFMEEAKEDDFEYVASVSTTEVNTPEEEGEDE